MSPPSCAAAVVLAAGQGTRMRSGTPKVLHLIAGRSMVGHALAAVSQTSPDQVVVVVRHDRDRVAGHITEVAPDALVADQDEVPGTGRAFGCAVAALDAAASATGAEVAHGRVLVTYGDVPLLRPQTLRQLLVAAPDAVVSVLTAVVADPTGYGRIVRGADGGVERIVEHRDADPDVLAINEINTGLYVLDLDFARHAIGLFRPANAAGELYLTDVVEIAHRLGRSVAAVVAADPTEVDGVNDRVQLAQARRRFADRLLDEHMRAGVDIVDPATTWVDVTVELAPDSVVHPGTLLQGATRVAAGAEVGPDSTLRDTVVGEGATVVRSHVIGARIGPRASVGPFSYLRPGTVLAAGSKVGAYVETKNATIGVDAKVPHLSYVGDAEVGDGANIGAGTIVANYDGVAKHRTTVGAHVRVGSNTVLVAPVTVGDGAYTAAGSVVVSDVPPGALAVARGALHVSTGWVGRRRPGTAAADAAEAAERAQNGHTGAGTPSPSDHSDQPDSSRQSLREGQDA